MSNYIKTRVYLSDGQKGKIKTAYNKNEEITLQITKGKTPNFDILLTKTQINQITNGKRITLSKTQLNKNKSGGFLPFLIPILTTLATGALSGAAGYGVKKALDKISGSGTKKKRRGKGVLQNWELAIKK